MDFARIMKLVPLVLLVLLLLRSWCSHGPWAIAAVSDVPETDLDERSILTAFKSGIVRDPNGTLSTWQASQSLCTWKGVACADGRVFSLELPGYGLSGSISPLLFTLPFLNHLNLSSNGLNGSLDLPANTTSSSSLVSVDLSSNLLGGSMPAWIGKLVNLEVLLLTNNFFSGPIPVDLGLCNRLVSLELGNSPDSGHSRGRINGTIPDSLANCSSLINFRLSLSRVSGELPVWLGSLKNLQALSFQGNALTGRIPSTVGNLTSLKYLNLLDNDGLVGEIPPEIQACSSMVVLALGMSQPEYFGKNQISGAFPTFVTNMSSLQNLVISGTQITGSIPEELGMLKSLIELNLYANSLSGEIPQALGNLSNLEFLNLKFGDFTGTIPRELGSCINLSTLGIGASSNLGASGSSLADAATYIQNDLTGPIPQELTTLPFLKSLTLAYTQIYGEVPSFRNSTSLGFLQLRSNNLSGGIPDDLPNSLQLLDLAFNRLSGPMPRSIGNLSNLIVFSIFYNDVSGTIPRELAFCRVLQTLYVGGSSLYAGPVKSMITGSIPDELGQLGQLSKLELKSTYLSGAIPSSLGNCSSLTTLSLNNNNLSGAIPNEISNMTMLINLDLRSNRLEGLLSTIQWGKMSSLDTMQLSRNSFSDLPQDLDMAKIAYLFISENKLSGSLPLSLRNCSYLQFIDMQHNKLGGNINDALDVLSDTVDRRGIRAILLSSNLFQGSIPPWIGSRFTRLSILVLAENQLEGSIPPSISLLLGLQQKNITQSPRFVYFRQLNEYLDPLVFIDIKNVTQGFFGMLLSITILDLSNNNLDGDIPWEMSSLVGLKYLNLSGNHLSGIIPISFSNLDSLAQMDLSENDLIGGIPTTFGNLTNLAYLDVSNNNLSGEIPPSFATRFDSASYIGNSGLCGKPLVLTCSKSTLPPTSPPLKPIQVSSGSSYMSWVAFCIGCTTSFLCISMLFLFTTRGLDFIFGTIGPPSYIRLYGLYKDPL